MPSHGGRTSTMSTWRSEASASTWTWSRHARVLADWEVGARSDLRKRADSHVEAELHHVAVSHHIILAFHPHPATRAGLGHRAGVHQILEGDHFGLDEALLEIGVDHAR